MVRKSSIIPTDLSSSREYYGLNNSQDIYKGTSFKFSGNWMPNTHYFNDEYIIDFVTYPYTNHNGDSEMAMWVCSRNHLSSNPPSLDSREWTYVMSGATGLTGQTYVPSVDKSGNLIFTLSEEPSSSIINIATIKGKDGVDGKNGKDGQDGKDGKVYIPSVKDGIMTFTLADSGMAAYRINVDDFKGEKGESGKPVEIKVLSESGDRVLYYREEGSSDWIKAGNVGGQPGKSPKLTVWFDDNSDIRDDQIRWGYDGVPVSEWSTLCYLDELRGDSITDVEINSNGQLEVTTSYKRKTENGETLTEVSKYSTNNTVLPEFRTGSITTVGPDDKANVSINKTSNPKEWEINYAIPSGRNATVDISRTITLDPDTPAAVINEGTLTNAQLRFEIPKGQKGDPGDQNVYIGCDAPEDKSQIWYDPCDSSIGEIDSLKVVYDAYLQSGGSLDNIEFRNAFRDFSKLGFEVKWAATFDDLGDPTEDKLGYLWVVNSGTNPNDMYEEWVVVNTAATGSPIYKWEKWGSGTISTDVNLENYYTKDQVDQHISNAINQFDNIFNGGEVDASGWD